MRKPQSECAEWINESSLSFAIVHAMRRPTCESTQTIQFYGIQHHCAQHYDLSTRSMLSHVGLRSIRPPNLIKSHCRARRKFVVKFCFFNGDTSYRLHDALLKNLDPQIFSVTLPGSNGLKIASIVRPQ
jgi:hypothetical protein